MGGTSGAGYSYRASGAGEWGEVLPYHKRMAPTQYLDEVLPMVQRPYRPLECMLSAGDVLAIPSGWWNLVLAVEDSIALAGDSADAHSVRAVMGELRKRVRQIPSVSSCVTALEKNMPTVGLGTFQAD